MDTRGKDPGKVFYLDIRGEYPGKAVPLLCEKCYPGYHRDRTPPARSIKNDPGSGGASPEASPTTWCEGPRGRGRSMASREHEILFDRGAQVNNNKSCSLNY